VWLTVFIVATNVASPRVVAPTWAGVGWPSPCLGIHVRTLVGRSTNRHENLDGKPSSVDDGVGAFWARHGIHDAGLSPVVA
jgi:hypothetical protein